MKIKSISFSDIKNCVLYLGKGRASLVFILRDVTRFTPLLARLKSCARLARPIDPASFVLFFIARTDNLYQSFILEVNFSEKDRPSFYSHVIVFISQFHVNQMFSIKLDPCI